MPFAAALSTIADSARAIADVCDQTVALASADLALLFFSTHHAPAAAELVQQVHARTHPALLLGCVAETVIGNDREVEAGPAVCLWLAKWAKGVKQTPFHLSLESTADGPSLLGWPDELPGSVAFERDPFAPTTAAILLLGDPFSFPTDQFLTRINDEAPGIPVLGGMASGVKGGGQCRLLYGKEVRREGAVGVLLQGELGLRWVVSQGCRPIGRHMIITKSRGNVILELGGRSPLEQLRELWQVSGPKDRELLRRGMFVGRVLNEYQSEFQRGDFLIRNVMGVDEASGAMAITDNVRIGQTIQFQVRDAESADEDLQALLQMDLGAHEKQPAAALVFSCNGRGTHMFHAPNHDARVIRRETGSVPLAGFFAMGELGPVGGRNFIHGFTASVALFED